jgi:hypothetical protein
LEYDQSADILSKLKVTDAAFWWQHEWLATFAGKTPWRIWQWSYIFFVCVLIVVSINSIVFCCGDFG